MAAKLVLRSRIIQCRISPAKNVAQTSLTAVPQSRPCYLSDNFVKNWPSRQLPAKAVNVSAPVN